MNYYFEPAPDLLLNLNLKLALSDLDRSKLAAGDESRYDLDQVKLDGLVKKYYPDDKQCFFDFYGDNFVNMASITTWHLPEQLEKSLLDEYKYFFSLINEAPEIRLQAIAGTHLPVHIDNARSVSIVHPLKNHLNTWTKFYDHDIDILDWNEHYSAIKDKSWPDCKAPWEFKFLPESIKTELLNIPGTYTLLTDRIRQTNSTVVNPDQVTEVCEVKIDKFPYILNVNKCHSVYCPDAPTDKNPRLAVFFKWRKASFTQIVDAYTQYVQSKI
jgi:hypothetical protein